MRHVVRFAGIILAALLLTPAAASAHERIMHFDSRVEIHADASLTVTETIRVYAAGKEIKRGIYRDFPQAYRGRWGLWQRTGFKVLQVRRDGNPEPYHLKARSNGTRVYIGQGDVMLAPGEHTYELTYHTDRQLGFFDEYDQLYWNVTGNDWIFPINRATATVILPPGATLKDVKAYAGKSGSSEQDHIECTPAESTAQFATTRSLAPGEGLTIVAIWPKGFVAPLTGQDKWLNMLRDNPDVVIMLAGLLLVFAYFMVVWSKVGRDPVKGIIIPQYGPPPDFSPAACRYLAMMRFDHKAFAANLISLATKGALSIQQNSDKSYSVISRKSTVEMLPDERVLFNELLGSRHSVALNQDNHTIIGSALSDLRKALESKLQKTHFSTNFRYWLPGFLLTLGAVAFAMWSYKGGDSFGFAIMFLGWSFGLIYLFASSVKLWRARQWFRALGSSLVNLLFLGVGILITKEFAKATSNWIPALMLLIALLNALFHRLLRARTELGRRMLDHIEGFRLYLSVAEKDRLNLENPPERTPELFEQFLPYALALNVEQQWAEQFETVLAQATAVQDGDGQASSYSPSWYRGTSWESLGAAGFASSFGSSLTGAISSSSTPPGSSDGYSGGGGSSGGGGGGGGGGGW